jgi:cell division protein FtsB
MGRIAVATLPSRALPGDGPRSSPDPAVEAQLATLKKQIGYGRKYRPGRSHVALIVLIVVASWVVLSFGRTITSLNAATDRQATLTAETAALTARLEAGHREMELIQTDAFQALQARAYGIGGPGEVAFALDADAPPPPAITPLGGDANSGAPLTPLDAWMRLLFGN